MAVRKKQKRATLKEAKRLLAMIVAKEPWSNEQDELCEKVNLGDMSFCAFRPFINVWDAGDQYITHTITKEARHLKNLYWQIKRQGTKPHLLFEDGMVFEYWNHYKRHIYGPEHAEKHIFENRVTYYTSGDQGLGLIYNDIDAHHPYQTDEHAGLTILKELFPDAYYRSSARGQNQFVKVRYSSPEEFNDLCDRAQEKIRLLFLSQGILCDFETKGTITREKSGRLAKLPFMGFSYSGDDSDRWNINALVRFHTSPIYTVAEIERILDGIVIDESAARAMAERKRELAKTEAEAEVPARLPRAIVASSQRRGSVTPATAHVQPRQATRHHESYGNAEGDAFQRNWRDLPPFVRQYFKRHRVLPDVDAALAYLHDNGLFSGAWSDSVNRPSRVASILKLIAQDFDETKLGAGDHQELNPQKFAWGVNERFGSRMNVAQHTSEPVWADDPWADGCSLNSSTRTIRVPSRFVCGFLAAAEIGIGKSENGRLSTNWFKEMFRQMNISWNQDYYRATRDKLHKMGVIQIIDRHHSPGVAWKWSNQFNIPASWKEEQRALKAKIVKGDPEELPSFFPCITVYTNDLEELEEETPFRPPRPSPDGPSGSEMCSDDQCFETICGEGLSWRAGE